MVSVLQFILQPLEILFTRTIKGAAEVIRIDINLEFIVNIPVAVFMDNIIDAGVAKYVLNILGRVADLISMAPGVDFCQKYTLTSNPRKMVDQR